MSHWYSHLNVRSTSYCVILASVLYPCMDVPVAFRGYWTLSLVAEYCSQRCVRSVCKQAVVSVHYSKWAGTWMLWRSLAMWRWGVHTHACTHNHTQTCTYTHPYTCTHTTHRSVRTCTYTHPYTCTHTNYRSVQTSQTWRVSWLWAMQRWRKSCRTLRTRSCTCSQTAR